jgi:hypothetical protein
MNKRSIHLLSALVVLFFSNSLYAQQLQRILHLRGTKTINGIGVTVTKTGKADSLHYCGEDTGPYYVGYNYANTGAADGSYTFTFSKPVDEIVLNLAAMSHSTGTYAEEARIFVNGAHYRFTKLGTSNNCGETMAIITREGDISPCANCTGSGTNGVKIKGPITTITVECNILSGEPMGFVVGVWMSGKASDNMVSYKTNLTESDAGEGKELLITGPLENANIVIKDSQGNPMAITFRTKEKSRLTINISEWPKGDYILEIEQNKKIEKTTIKIT